MCKIINCNTNQPLRLMNFPGQDMVMTNIISFSFFFIIFLIFDDDYVVEELFFKMHCIIGGPVQSIVLPILHTNQYGNFREWLTDSPAIVSDMFTTCQRSFMEDIKQACFILKFGNSLMSKETLNIACVRTVGIFWFSLL